MEEEEDLLAKIKAVGASHGCNALYSSMAVYKPDPADFLNKDQVINHHQIDQVCISQHWEQKVMLAISREAKTLYMAVRGSVNKEDWSTNLTVGLAKLDHYPGKCHAGYLKRSSMMSPANILQFARQNDLGTIVICGHSLGGAVSTLMALQLHQVSADSNVEIFNITFGSPYTGNSELSLYCQKEGIAHKFLHYVNNLDPIPNLLSLGSTVADLLSTISGENLPTEVQHVYLQAKQFLKYLKPFLDGLMAIASFSSNEKVKKISTLYSLLTQPKEKPSLQWNINEKNKYVPNGHYLLMTDEKSSWIDADSPEITKVVLGESKQNFKFYNSIFSIL